MFAVCEPSFSKLKTNVLYGTFVLKSVYDLVSC